MIIISSAPPPSGCRSTNLRKPALILLLHVNALVLVLLCTSGQRLVAQSREDIYEEYKTKAAAQAQNDPLIGIWSGSLCTKRILLAVIQNDERNSFDLKAVILNGKEVGYGFKNADPWFYVSRVAAAGVYEGKTIYRNRWFKNWFPNRIVLTSEDVFSATDDASNSCGPPTTVYVRKETRPHSAAKGIARSGSGFLLRHTDLIVTAYHVVDGASQISVHFPRGVAYKAEIVARDLNNDLAMLKLLQFIPAENGFDLNLEASMVAGDPIHVIGFPLAGELGDRPSIVSGAVSSTTGLDDSPAQFRITAPVNPGNSGGPILNGKGEVVGVVVSSLVGQNIAGVNFGLKISAALPLLQQVGVKASGKKWDNVLTASQIFSASSDNVVLVQASAQPK